MSQPTRLCSRSRSCSILTVFGALILLCSLAASSAQNSLEQHTSTSTRTRTRTTTTRTKTPHSPRSDTLTFIQYENQTLHELDEPILHSVTTDFVAMHCGWDKKTLLMNWATPSKSIVTWHVKRNGVWEEGGKLEHKRERHEEVFGRSLSVDGHVAVVGAPQIKEGNGSAYIFIATLLGWKNTQRIEAPTSRNTFGWQVSNTGEWLAISAPFGPHTEGRGSVYLYKETDKGSWTFHQVLQAPYDAQSFGADIALTRNKLAVFAQADSVGKTRRGHNIFIYRYTDSVWSQEAVVSSISEDNRNSLFDYSMFSHKLQWQSDALIVATFSSKGWTPLLHVYIETCSGWVLFKSFNYPLMSFDHFLWSIQTLNARKDSITYKASRELQLRTDAVAQSVCTYALTVHSSGSGLGDRQTYIYLQGIDQLASYGRGINVATFNFGSLPSGATSTGVFDLFQNSSASQGLINYIEKSADGVVFAFAVQDEGSNTVTSALRSAMSSHFGAILFATLGYANSYILIGVKGKSSPAAELVSATKSLTQTACLDNGVLVATDGISTSAPSQAPSGVTAVPTSLSTCSETLAALSYGSVAGIGSSYIQLNGKNLLSTYGRGIDIAVLSLDSYAVVASDSFDTFQDSTASDSCTSFINGLSAGLLFVFVVQDEASNLLTTNLKHVVGTNFGATQFASLGYGNSYLLIAVKGSSQPLYESLSAKATVQSVYCLISGISGTSAPSVTPTSSSTLLPTAKVPTGAPSEPTILPTNSHSITFSPSASPTVLASSVFPSLVAVPSSVSSNPVDSVFPSASSSSVSSKPSSFPSIATSPASTVLPSVAHSNPTAYPSTVYFSSITPTNTLSHSPFPTSTSPATLSPSPATLSPSPATLSPSDILITPIRSVMPSSAATVSPSVLPVPSGVPSASPVSLSPSSSFSASPTTSASLSPVPVSSPFSGIPTISPSSAPTSTVAFAARFQESRPFISLLVSGLWIGFLFTGIVMLVLRRGATVESKKQEFDPVPATAIVTAPLARAESELHNFIVEVIPTWMQGGEQLSTLSHFLLVTHSWVGLFCTSDLGGSRLVRHFGKMLDALTIMFTSSLMFSIMYPGNGLCETKVMQLSCENVGSTRGSESECVWQANVCTPRHVELNPQIILTVSMYAILLAWPLLILIGYLVQRVLSHIAAPNFPDINASERGETLLMLLPEDLRPHTPTLATVAAMATKSLETEAKYVEEIRAESGYGYMNTHEELLHMLRDARTQAKNLSNVIAHSRTAANKDIYLMRAFILQHLDEVSQDVLAPVLLPMQLRHSPLPKSLFVFITVFLVLYPFGLLTFIIMFGAFVSTRTTIAWVVSVLVLVGLVFGLSEFLQLICMRLFPSTLLGPTVRHVCRTIHSQLRQRVTHSFKRDLDLNTMWHTNHVHRVCAGLPRTSFSTTCVLYLLGEHMIERCPFPGTSMSLLVMRYMQILIKLPDIVYMPTHHMLVSVLACIIGTELFQHLQYAVALVLLLSCCVCCMCCCACTGSRGALNRFTPSNSTKQLMRRVFENESDTDYDNDNGSRGRVSATGRRARGDIFEEVGSDEEYKSCDDDIRLLALPVNDSPRRRLVVYTHVPQTESSYPEPAPVQTQIQQLPLGQRSMMYMLSAVAAMRSNITSHREAISEPGNRSEISDNSLEERPSRLGLPLSRRAPFFPLVARRRRGHRPGDRSRRGLIRSEETDSTRTSETDPVEYKRTYVFENACIYEDELQNAQSTLPAEAINQSIMKDEQEYMLCDSGAENPLSRFRNSELSEEKLVQSQGMSLKSSKKSSVCSDSKNSNSSSPFKREVELEYDELYSMEMEPKYPTARRNGRPKDPVVVQSKASNRRRTRSLPRTKTKPKSVTLQLEEGDENWNMNVDTQQYTSSSSWSLHLAPPTSDPNTLTGLDEPTLLLPRRVSNPSASAGAQERSYNPRPRSPRLWDDSSSECSSVLTTRGWDPSCTDILGPRARVRKVRSFWRRRDDHAGALARRDSQTRIRTQEPIAPSSSGTYSDVIDNEDRVFW